MIEGGIAVDDRESLIFVNGFDMESIFRFYTVINHNSGFVRAWHAHKQEAKYIAIVNGSAIIAAVEVDNWDQSHHLYLFLRKMWLLE